MKNHTEDTKQEISIKKTDGSLYKVFKCSCGTLYDKEIDRFCNFYETYLEHLCLKCQLNRKKEIDNLL